MDGDVRRVNFSNWFRSLGWVLWLGWWLAVTVSLFVFGVLLLAFVPRIFPPILEVARTRVGPVILWGLIATIGLPIACAIVMVTLVGIPLGLIGLLSLALLYSLGFVIASLTLGRRLLAEPRSVYLAFFVGLIILRVVGLIPVLGGLVTLAAIVYGVGALTITVWRGGSRAADVRATTQCGGVAGANPRARHVTSVRVGDRGVGHIRAMTRATLACA